MGCSFRPDWVAGFLRMRWQLCTGLGGRNHRNTQEAEKYAATWLGRMGLQLKTEKTRIVHSLLKHEGNEPGFNFLGFNCRQYRRTPEGKFKTLIKPEKDKVRRHLKQIGKIIREMGTNSQREVIGKINPRIAGWSNYYRTCVAGTTFKKAEDVVYWQLKEWTKKVRRVRSTKKRMRKYFKETESRKWVFATSEGKKLLRHDAKKIVRHIKVLGSRSPFDGDWAYGATRLGHSPLISPFLPYTFFLLNGDMALNKNRQIFVHNLR